MRVVAKWVVVGTAAAVAGFAGAAATGDTARDIKLNDPIAVEEVAGQLSADDPSQHLGQSADDPGQHFGDDDSPASPASPGGSPQDSADSPDSGSGDHANSTDSPSPESRSTANSQQGADDSRHDGASSADNADD
jgi:hypothetical protein